MSRLQRSMSTLEALAADGIPLSFSELNSKLGGIHRATLSSILKELMSLGYVHKNAASGKYECGSRLALFLNVRKEGRAESLLNKYVPLMQEISRTFEVTAILFERVYDVLMSIHKEMHPCSPVMQEVGAVNRNLWENPWGRCFIAFDGKLSDACNGRENVLADIRRAAYAFDDGEYYEHMRRLGFPIVDIDGRIEGCLGIGAISATLDDRRKDELVSFIASNLANEYKPFDNTI